ncbi:D-2-hydroxyacid dehydrogenase [Patescibacteria group bacterium]|nr:D-2-hydroxyacid dehydrogenase [Patescibacteria group bacterium]
MKILLIEPQDRPLRSITKEQKEQILSLSPEIELKVVSAADSKEITEHVSEAEVVVGLFRSLPSIKETKNLKWVHGLGAGMDALSKEIINSSILVSNSSGVAAISIAEHIITFLLIFTRKIYQSFRNQQEKIWERNNELTELRDKVVLVVGLGHIGKETARLASLMGAKVLAIDQAGKEKPDFVETLETKEKFNELLPLADFVVICAPLTKETHHLFGKEKFKQMKPTAVLVNIGRGAIVNERELIDALENKVIAGAALDVTEEEPLAKESPLWEMDNVIITPHHSGISERYMERAIDLFCENLKAYLKGEKLPNLVDKSAGY